jgi:hypothetical protein
MMGCYSIPSCTGQLHGHSPSLSRTRPLLRTVTWRGIISFPSLPRELRKKLCVCLPIIDVDVVPFDFGDGAVIESPDVSVDGVGAGVDWGDPRAEEALTLLGAQFLQDVVGQLDGAGGGELLQNADSRYVLQRFLKETSRLVRFRTTVQRLHVLGVQLQRC